MTINKQTNIFKNQFFSLYAKDATILLKRSLWFKSNTEYMYNQFWYVCCHITYRTIKGGHQLFQKQLPVCMYNVNILIWNTVQLIISLKHCLLNKQKIFTQLLHSILVFNNCQNRRNIKKQATDCLIYLVFSSRGKKQ